MIPFFFFAAVSVGGATTTEEGTLSPQEGVRGDDAATRGNVDSGFISEAPEDLSLVRGTSVESLPGADVSPPAEGGVADGRGQGEGGVASPDAKRYPVAEDMPTDQAPLASGDAHYTI